MRIVAVSADKRQEGINAPTLKEEGIDVELFNWRGVFAPPGVNDTQRKAMIALIEKMTATPQWAEACKTRDWTPIALFGDEYKAFLETETARIESILKELGLALTWPAGARRSITPHGRGRRSAKPSSASACWRSPSSWPGRRCRCRYRRSTPRWVMLLVLNLPLIAVWVKLLQIPAPILYAGILVFATIGTYGITQSPVDLILLYLIGGIGYLMRRYDFPAAPVIIGMILGPLAEQNFRQAMTISAGDWTVFFTRPLSATILALAALALFGPKLYQLAVRPKPDRLPGDA